MADRRSERGTRRILQALEQRVGSSGGRRRFGVKLLDFLLIFDVFCLCFALCICLLIFNVWFGLGYWESVCFFSNWFLLLVLVWLIQVIVSFVFCSYCKLKQTREPHQTPKRKRTADFFSKRFLFNPFTQPKKQSQTPLMFFCIKLQHGGSKPKVPVGNDHQKLPKSHQSFAEPGQSCPLKALVGRPTAVW